MPTKAANVNKIKSGFFSGIGIAIASVVVLALIATVSTRFNINIPR